VGPIAGSTCPPCYCQPILRRSHGSHFCAGFDSTVEVYDVVNGELVTLRRSRAEIAHEKELREGQRVLVQLPCLRCGHPSLTSLLVRWCAEEKRTTEFASALTEKPESVLSTGLGSATAITRMKRHKDGRIEARNHRAILFVGVAFWLWAVAERAACAPDTALPGGV
jgi:hypothetical protein